VHSADKVSLLGGEALVRSPAPGAAVQVHAPPATVLVEAARVELLAPRLDTLTVTVLEGEATAQAGETTRRIAPAHSVTFRKGGQPVDITDTLRRWEQRINRQPQRLHDAADGED